MGAMAGKAPFSLRYSRMSFYDRLSLLPVAFQAKPVSLLYEKGRVLRGMRIVAGEAGPLLEGIMKDRPACLHFGFIVALVAQSAALLRRRERFLSGRRGMARIAAFLDHGVVSA